MDFILDMAIKFWPMTVFIILVIIGSIVNLFDRKMDNRVNFKYIDYPHMKPIRIATKGKGFWGAIILWFFGTRHWEVVKDFNYSLDGKQYIIPKGFKFDGASVPKFLASFLSPIGVLLIGGLVHDYAYKYTALRQQGTSKGAITLLDKAEADRIFRDINIEVNGFHLLNYLTYWVLRGFGFVAWNKHRKVNAKIK